jgi:hemolysin activation/secretion protein
MESTPITSSRVVADNLGSRATGQSRLIYQLFLDSPFGQAERVSALAMVSKGTRVLQLGAAVPVGDVGGKLQFNASRLAYEIDGPEGLRGSAWSPSISVSWPQFFSSTVQSTESVSVSYNRLQNEALNLEISDKRITSLDVRSEGNLLLADSPVSYRVGLRVGDADLSNNASDLKQDAQTAGVNGGFWRLSTDLAYSQRLNDSVELRIRARGQYSADNLDSSQKMSLGGRYGVRAYPVGEAAASTAGLVQAGLRVAGQEQLAASVFADVGWVQRNPDPWIGWQSNNSALENEYHLAGLGVGLDWKPLPGIRFTANAAHSVGNNPGRSSEGKDADGRDGDYRAWLELSVSF